MEKIKCEHCGGNVDYVGEDRNENDEDIEIYECDDCDEFTYEKITYPNKP